MKRFVALAVVVAACGTTPAVASPGVQSSTPVGTENTITASAEPIESATSASPTLSEDELRSAAAEAYVSAAEVVNEASTALQERYRYAQTLEKLREYCSKVAEVYRTFDQAMLALVVPDDAEAAIEELVRTDSAAGANLQSCAVAESLKTWNRAWELARTAFDDAHEAANLVRLRLGLPPVPS